MLDGSEIGDGVTEGFALFRVFQTHGQDILCSADRQRTQLQPTDIQNIECNYVTAPDLAEDIFDGHANIIEVDGGGGTAFDAHLVFLGAAGNAGESALDQRML